MTIKKQFRSETYASINFDRWVRVSELVVILQRDECEDVEYTFATRDEFDLFYDEFDLFEST